MHWIVHSQGHCGSLIELHSAPTGRLQCMKIELLDRRSLVTSAAKLALSAISAAMLVACGGDGAVEPQTPPELPAPLPNFVRL
jgi:hypothetical protein